MTRRLILTRHAKSSWDDETLEDHDRPLNKRGHSAAQDIGEWLAQHDYLPDLVISSSAARTKETWESMAGALPCKPETRFERSLYDSSPEQILTALREVKDAQTVLLIAHNPGIALAANALAASPPHHPRFATYPTTATTVYQFNIDDWKQLTWGSGDVLDFALPREI